MPKVTFRPDQPDRDSTTLGTRLYLGGLFRTPSHTPQYILRISFRAFTDIIREVSQGRSTIHGLAEESL